MDSEFHYYVTGLIAQRAGFSDRDAKIIACSSEYVDENDLCFKIEDAQTGDIYENFISQTMNILLPKQELMRIYPIFHFVPGDPTAKSARRKDGKMHILNTTPDNDRAKALLADAFGATGSLLPYRIGIASHAYVDTWAHQNFVGWYSDFNQIGSNIIPNIGHADAIHHPDWIGHQWVDPRLVKSEVNNQVRFLEAAEALLRQYCTHLNKTDADARWRALETDLEGVFNPTFTGPAIKYKEERLKALTTLTGFAEFDEWRWYKEAIKKHWPPVDDSDGYWRDDIDKADTDWWRFQESVKAHEKTGIQVLSDLFEEMDVKIDQA
ncbi:MAG: hypothetical protein HQL52_06725 [Magnetococcales bacterium]|nr:hypothetical protein [Magnetococcales bacterium]